MVGDRGCRPSRGVPPLCFTSIFDYGPSPLSSKTQIFASQVQPSRSFVASKRSRAMFFRLFPESFSERVLRSVRPGGADGIRPARRSQESIVKMRHFVVSPSPLSSNLRKLIPKCNPLADSGPQIALAQCFSDFFGDVLYGSLTFATFSFPSLPGAISGPHP